MRRLTLAAVVMLSTVYVAAAKEHVAQRFDVTATVQQDGSLEVVEVIAFRFTGGEYTTVTRELRATETDGVEVLDAFMDGQLLPRGENEGQVEVDGGQRRVRIAWHFAPTVDRVHVFSLRYRYKGVVRHGEGHDWFRWPPFPSRFDYPIEKGTMRLFWPAPARLRLAPEIEGPALAPSELANGVEINIANYRERDDDVRVTVRFVPGAFAAVEPLWERDARRADRMAPAFMAAGVMILAAAALALWLFFLRYRRDGVEHRTAGDSVTAPPDDLPPAMAGAIASGRVSVAGPQLLAAVFDLARRGAIVIEEPKGGGVLSRRRFAVKRGSEAALRPHERAIVDALFKSGAREERFDRALRRMTGQTRKIGRAVQSELAAAGMIDSDRKEGASALTISGIVVIVLALAVTVGLAATGMRLGEASLAIPIAFAFSGLAMVIGAAVFSTLTPAGLRAARLWDGYKTHLKREIKQGRVPADGESIGRMLPFAAALGVLPAFGKALQKTEVRNLPPWLRTLDAAGGSNAALVALIATGSRSASHGTAGGRGGAGGVGAGGSSGAH